MFRTILSVTGVVLIGLGVFGGSLLEKMAAQFGSQPDQMASVEIPAANTPAVNTNVTANTTVNVASAEPAPAASVTPVVKTDAVAVVDAVAESKAMDAKVVATPSVAAAAAGVAKAAETVADAPVIAAAGKAEMVAVAGSTEEVAEPMAPAQAAGDFLAMAEQAKSSSRNEQVDLAETILASAKQTAEPVAKEAEVDSVMEAAAGEINNEILVVVKDKVNLRDGPSIDHPIVLQLEQGQELMEFKREGRWVHVGAYGTSGKIGWVHQRLVSTAR